MEAGVNGVERFADIRGQAPSDVDAFRAVFGYGGSPWSGKLYIEKNWTQADRTPAPAAIASVVDVDSRYTEDGQWITMTIEEFTTDGPPFGESAVEGPAPLFALIVAADGRIADAYPSDSVEIDSRNQRIWFGRLLEETLPGFPAGPLAPGVRWQVRAQGHPDGASPLYTITSVEDGLLRVDVAGDFRIYFGDRNDGFTVAAKIDGDLVIDWSSAIPVEAHIDMEGTITFGVGGEPDPSTSRPWRYTLDVEAVADGE